MSRPLVVAHRGAAAEAPENTADAFALALDLGADALELDVRRAGGGTLAVIHDATLDRTTRGRGPVAERGAGELAELGVPLLRDVLEAHPEATVTVDVKDAGATGDVVALIRKLDRVDRTVLYVEEGTGLPAFRSYPGRRATSRGQALRFALLDRWVPGLPRPTFPEVVHTPLRTWGVPVATRAFTAAVHRSGRTVQAWTVNEPERVRRLADWGVDAIVTDDVRTAVRVLGPSSPGVGAGEGPPHGVGAGDDAP